MNYVENLNRAFVVKEKPKKRQMSDSQKEISKAIRSATTEKNGRIIIVAKKVTSNE